MRDRPLSTIYFGGGTPTSLNPQDLDEILTKVEELFPVEQAVEFTVESGRPDSITREKLQVLRPTSYSNSFIPPRGKKTYRLPLTSPYEKYKKTLISWKQRQKGGKQT